MNTHSTKGKSNNRFTFAVSILFILFWQTQANATIISLESSTLTPSQNQQVTIDLWARDLGVEVVSGFDVDISFDNAAFSFQSARFSSLLGDAIDSFQATIDLGNIINLSELSLLIDDELFALQGGADFILGSLTFMVDQIGTTQVSISNSLVTGADPFSSTFAGTANTLTFDVAANQVPEPNTFLLFVLAIIVGRMTQKSPILLARKAK